MTSSVASRRTSGRCARASRSWRDTGCAERMGSYRVVLERAVPRFAPDGALSGYIGSCIDVTEQAQAEEEREPAAAGRGGRQPRQG